MLARLDGEAVHVAEEEARHLVRVLRLRAGDRFRAFDGSGVEVVAEVVEASRLVVGRVLERSRPAVEPRLQVTLYLSLARGERFEGAIEKAVELGVSRVVPLAAARAAVTDPGPSRLERWRRIARSAAAQSGRVVVPPVEAPVELSAACRQAALHDRALVFAPGHPPPAGAMKGTLAILVGPEGGFDPGELELARQAGLEAVGLGPRVLRVETAAVVALALCFSLSGDLGPAG